MKTEKRLTMALSVLVALMMLAVPLASSSNLFVDGGQTNSNGDAPLIGDASYRVDFILNEGSEGRTSLDKIDAIDLDTLNSKITGEGTAVFYQDENGNLFAVITGNVTIQQLIWVLTSNSVFNITKTGYILDSFVNNDTKAAFGPDKTNTSLPKAENGDKITKNMTLTATWLLDDSKYAEIPVDVVYEGETKEYVKVFPKFKGTYEDDTVIDEKNVYILVTEDSFLNVGIDGLDTYGIVVNAKDSEDKIAEIYTFKTTYGDNKEISSEVSSTAVKVPVTSKLTMTYTFNDSKFSKIVVSSIAFKDGKDVTLYADKVRSYSYVDVYDALTAKTIDNSDKLTFDLPILDLEDESEILTVDGYKLTGWNEGAQLLKSENNASSPLTLDAELNGYYVIFMSKGQSEYVYVPFGELSADKTTLDISGVNHWVYIAYSAYGAAVTTANIEPFNFASTTDVEKVEKSDATKEPTAVLIACFTPTSSTAYAVFDANGGNFGNEYVTKIVIPGKTGNAIPLPSSNPVYGDEDSRTVFLGWDRAAESNSNITPTLAAGDGEPSGEVNSSVYAATDKYGVKDAVTGYTANPQPYTYTITFYDGSNVVGVFYYDDGVPTTDINTGLVAFEYDGEAYEYPIVNDDAAEKAFENILLPDKAGYHITQWNDADKNKVITIKNNVVDKVDIKDMKDDLNLYAQFEPESYVIQYLNTYGSGYSSQDAKVDQTVTLYTGATFVYDGYKLVGWSDRPDGDGTKYELGASFTLNGEQYEDLKVVDGNKTLTLYAIWEKSGSGSGSGNNNEGSNDSNTDTYLLAGILIVIIILIVVMAVVLRKK